MSDIVVIIPSVPRRAADLERLLFQLAEQTCPPDKVIVLRDGWDRGVYPTRPMELSVLHVETHEDKAQCYRWSIVEQLPAVTQVLTLDDDMRIPPDYIAHTLRALATFERKVDRNAVLSWGGITPDFHWVGYDARHGEDRLVRMQSGVLAFRAGLFHGVTDTDFARRSHVRGGSEELPLAWWCWMRGIPVFTPGGLSGLEATKAAHEPEASHRVNVEHWIELLDWARHNLPEWEPALGLWQMYQGKRPASVRALLEERLCG